jgi:hypothetical protein
MTTRRALLTTLGGLTVLGGTAGMYGFWIEPAYRLAIAEYRLNPPNWPAGRPITIAALADIHASEPQVPLERVAEIVAAANALNPDLVVLLGDYRGGGFGTRGIPVKETAAVLRGLRAPHGVHAILGNHDWWDDPQVQRFRRGVPRTARILADAGISVLHNAAVKTGFGGRGFWVAGTGSLWAFRETDDGRFLGANDLNRALGAVQDRDPVILLCHEPDIFPSVPAGRVALTLCGHTHGGQVRLAGFSPYVPSRYGNRYAYGHVVEEAKNLVVSGGLGTSILPVRVGVPPEITLIRLGYGPAA